MGLILIFFCGIGNFAAHKAVLESRHPLFDQMPLFFQLLGGRFSLLIEFAMLLGAMLMAAQGSLGWVLFYGAYTAVYALSAWLITSGRI